MKYFLFLTIIVFAFYLLGFMKKSDESKWLDKNYTTAIKGFSILTVVWAHVGGMLGVGGIQFIAGIGVALFLICSGYGLEISYERNGLKEFWKKRLLGVCMPFWVVELVGILITEKFSIKTYLLDSFFLKPATSYGWFIGYIIICYLIFFAVKRIIRDEKIQMLALFAVFIVWFVIDSVCFANPDMPALRARQMLSFPCGVALALNKSRIEYMLSKLRNMSIITLFGGGTLCILFMAITQLGIVKSLPYLFSNIMALPTCLPMAVGIIVFGKQYRIFFENKMLKIIGTLSYEIYLVHAFTLNIIKPGVLPIGKFIIITLVVAGILHIIIEERKNDRFNSRNFNKK